MENGKVAAQHIQNCDIARTKQIGIFRTKDWWGKISKIGAAWLRWHPLFGLQLSCHKTSNDFLPQMLAYSLHWFWTTNRVRTPNRQKLFLNLAATQISYFHFDLTFSMLCYLSFFFNFFSSRWTRDDIKLLKEKKLVSSKNFHYRCFLTFDITMSHSVKIMICQLIISYSFWRSYLTGLI